MNPVLLGTAEMAGLGVTVGLVVLLPLPLVVLQQRY
jgi:hypothetical protein